MRILLVQPSVGEERRSMEESHSHLQPLTPAVLAGITPDSHSVEFVDDRLQPIPAENDFDLVAITTTTLTVKRAYEIADTFRERNVPVVLGGHHATLRSEEAKQHAASVIVGEAETIWEEVLEDCSKSDLDPFYSGEQPNPEQFPVPDRSIFRGKDYLPVEMVETTRGCPHSCTFCSVTSFFGPGYRHKPIEAVVKEIKSLDRNYIFFVDDNIVGDFKYAKRLFRALAPLNIKWFSQGSIRMARDDELLDLMKKSGCLGNLIGLESIDPASLKEINKSWNVQLSFPEAIRKIHSHGLSIFASFVIGLDSDKPPTIGKTLDFALESKFLAANFNILVPYPGTKLYDRLKDEDRLFDEQWWLNDEREVKYRPVNFTPSQLLELQSKAKWKFYRYPHILRRISNWKPNFGSPATALLFLALNRAIHKEQAKRQKKLRARNYRDEG